MPEFLAPKPLCSQPVSKSTWSASGASNLAPEALDAVTAAHPRPEFKNRILAAFNDGMKHRPQTTFGTMNADVLERFDPTFERDNLVEHILNSTWPE